MQMAYREDLDDITREDMELLLKSNILVLEVVFDSWSFPEVYAKLL